MRPQLELACGRLPRTLIGRFVDAARAAAPAELAGALVYDPHAGQLQLVLHTSVCAHAGQVAYRLAPLAPQQLVVLDLHSHGHGPAYFSAGDDRDDRGMCLAMVVGDLQRGQPSVAFRLCLNGLLLALPHPWQEARGTGAGAGAGAGDTGSSTDPAKEIPPWSIY
ncbi:PRTRC system protein A [Rugamonas aquatica]|uniref:PRTRC system protein A n=1 Tax=Rugamonas aquatica TaxID=2743357 RepID=A0A6A7N6M8_9BURK|nr:PRTRC system protein A [Rugamonas aquatica]MQA40571.1 PRTRC system protein A [Rugamonas aquatica]